MNNPRKLNGHGALRSVLEAACRDSGCSLADLTVLSAQVDPYRLDTPAGHRDGRWAAEQLDRLWHPRKQAHFRGLHYAIIMGKKKILKPNGETFQNSHRDWKWLSESACKAARWLGYIPFDRIIDRRNSDPLIYRAPREVPESWVDVEIDVKIPELGEPTPVATGFAARQAYHFVIFGEKSSLQDILQPLAEQYGADLYLPTGEISDTLLYRIAKDAAEDGRPLVLFTVADCDPAGHQMPVSIARKLQALRDFQFPDLQFEVVPAALTTDQVNHFGLPSTPLKEEEKRADRWREAFGIEQTEVDALTTPEREGELREIVERAFDPYFDRSLQTRVRRAETKWHRAAEAALSQQVDNELLSNLREQGTRQLNNLQERIERIDKKRWHAVADVVLPEIVVPQPRLAETARQALVSIDQDWGDATRALIQHKSYGEDEE